MTTQITLPRKVVEQAIEAWTLNGEWKSPKQIGEYRKKRTKAVEALRAALTEQVQPSKKVDGCQWCSKGACYKHLEDEQPAQGERAELIERLNNMASRCQDVRSAMDVRRVVALLQSNAERVPLEPVNCDTCRYHYKDVDQKPCNTCIHSGDFGSNFEPRFEITKGQQ